MLSNTLFFCTSCMTALKGTKVQYDIKRLDYKSHRQCPFIIDVSLLQIKAKTKWKGEGYKVSKMSKLQELGSNDEIEISETNAVWRIKSFLISLKTSKKIHYSDGK